MTQAMKNENSQTSQSRLQQPNDLQPARDFVCYVKQYARQKPDVAALWCFGIGFVLGWKVKPW